MSDTIGFIGLGIMGRPMALNLIKAGHALSVHARRAESMAPLTAAGAIACASPAEVARQADVIFTMVSDTPDVEEVVLGSEGVIEGVRPGSVVVDMSTTSPSATRAMAERLSKQGCCDARRPRLRRRRGGGERHPLDHGRRPGDGLRAGPPPVRGDGQEHRARGPERRGAGVQVLQPGADRAHHRRGRRGHAPGACLRGGPGEGTPGPARRLRQQQGAGGPRPAHDRGRLPPGSRPGCTRRTCASSWRRPNEPGSPCRGPPR